MKNRLIALIIATVSLIGCSSMQGSSVQEEGVGKATPLPPQARLGETVELQISRNKLKEQLSKVSGENRIRMVDVFKKDGGYPEYHLFGIQDQSVYTLLGLQNEDVLVAANDFVVFDRNGFPKFVSLFPQVKEASIRFRRGDKMFNYHYVMTEP